MFTCFSTDYYDVPRHLKISIMAIKQSVRDKLIIHSAGKCAKCQRELLVEGKKVCNVGEVCHIISKQKSGPRYQAGLEDYDSFDNLIVLCANCHKEVDTNVEEYTIEKLKEMKFSHDRANAERLKSQKNKTLIFSKRKSGQELGCMIWGCHCYNISYEDLEGEGLNIINELDDYIQNLLNLQEYIIPNDKKDIYNDLQYYMQELGQLGYSVFAEKATSMVDVIKVSKLMILIAKTSSTNDICIRI